jgi:DNA-binding phage protein
MKDKPHDEAMAELYREEPDFAIATLNAVLQDGDQAELMVMLRQMTKAQLYCAPSPAAYPASR